MIFYYFFLANKTNLLNKVRLYFYFAVLNFIKKILREYYSTDFNFTGLSFEIRKTYSMEIMRFHEK